MGVEICMGMGVTSLQGGLVEKNGAMLYEGHR